MDHVASSPIHAKVMRSGSARLKRLFDVVAATASLLVLSPVFLLTAVIVLLALGRPLMFRQERVGRGRSIFEISKFRTMNDDRDAQGVLLADELRQTKATALLRRLRVDELPQLFAVARGDMSFVGPRPLPPRTIQEHGGIGTYRCCVSPGMTGWAQVNGNTRLSGEQKIALDVWYIDHRTMQLDVRIVFMTVWTLLAGEAVNQRNIDDAFSNLRRRALAMSSGQDGA